MLAFFNEDKRSSYTYGLILEILNFIFMVSAISVQITIKIKLKLSC